MRIAVPYQAGMVFGHFGHTSSFRFYTVENDRVTAIQTVPVTGSGHGALAAFLKDHDIDTLICGGIGGGAKTALGEAGIRIFGGVQGDADMAVAMFLAGKLVYDPEAHCDHHGEGDHDCHDHDCSGDCHH
ncbi:MAG: NifB/NifX family molybdenum-iron cluster-binding protein [Clostridia bacterium]|nr:NifB/NifX family molybdenum-iron cluster-binding protein [Clostridia bacterium]